MDEQQFKTQLRADGYRETGIQDYRPREPRGEHHHDFAIRGLVISGLFIVAQNGRTTNYGPGQVFDVALSEPHDEWIGPNGARVLVGRKSAAAG